MVQNSQFIVPYLVKLISQLFFYAVVKCIHNIHVVKLPNAV